MFLFKRALLWVVALVVVLGEGGFGVVLRGENESGSSTMSLQNLPPYAIGAGSLGLIAVYLLRQGRFAGTLPILLAGSLPLILIPVWGGDLYQQFRLTLVLSGYLFACVAVCMWMTSEDIIGIVFKSLLIGTTMSVALSILVPSIAVHASEDMSGSTFGAWRGIFGHKNEFGEFNDLVILFVAAVGIRTFKPIAIPALLLALAALSIVRSHSSGAIVTLSLAVLLTSATWKGDGPLYFRILRLPSRALLLLSPALVALAAQVIVLLGRDMTFTGRIYIWSAVWDVLPAYNLIGLGPAFFGIDLFPKLTLSFGAAFTDPHNGYLDALLSYGFLGLGFALFLAFKGVQAARRLMTASDGADLLLSRVALAFIFYMLCSSLDESTLVRGGYPPPFMGWFMACAAMTADQRSRRLQADQSQLLELKGQTVRVLGRDASGCETPHMLSCSVDVERDREADEDAAIRRT